MNTDIYTAIDQQNQTSNATEPTDTTSEYDKEQYAAKKKAERDDAYARIDKATERVNLDPVAFRDLLDLMARLPRYSVANALLIFDQKPDSTKLADFDTWKRNGASIKRGESAMAILEPGDEYTREDGSIGVSINVKKVFDESQTSARHLVPRYPDIKELLLALIESALVAIQTVDSLPEGTGFATYDNDNQTISVLTGLNEDELFKALATELAHAVIADADDFYNREDNHETAQLAAYAILGRYGVDNSSLMPVLSESFTVADPSEVRGELTRIRDTAKAVSDSMDRTLESNRAKTTDNQRASGDRDGR